MLAQSPCDEVDNGRDLGPASAAQKYESSFPFGCTLRTEDLIAQLQYADLHSPSGLLPVSWTNPSLTCGAIERLGTDAAQMAVAAGSVIEHLYVIEDFGSGQIPGFVDAFADAFLFKLLKNDSATALYQQLPRRLILGSRLWAWQKRRKSSLPY